MHRVQLVDEKNDLSFRVLDFLQHGLEPFLELAAVLGPRDQRAQVERNDALVLEAFRHVAAHDALGQPLDDGRLAADARAADQHRVVLGPPAEHLDHAPDLFVTANDRVELAVACVARQVAAVLLKRLVCALRVLRSDTLGAAHAGQRGQDLLLVRTSVIEDELRLATGLGSGDEQVFRRDVLVAETLGFVLRTLQQLPGARVDRHLATGDARAAPEHSGELDTHLRWIRSKLAERRGGHAISVLEQRGKDVFGVEDGAVLPLRQLLGDEDRFLRLVGVSIELHVWLASPVRVRIQG